MDSGEGRTRWLARVVTFVGFVLLLAAPVCTEDAPPGYVYGECSEGADRCCGDGQDNDNDTHVDCGDKDCLNVGPCTNIEVRCDDGLDDDNDGLVDCDDDDCTRACTVMGDEICEDGVDNDGDNDIDCADTECNSIAWCGIETSCYGGVDDDNDGATDCADPGCSQSSSCFGEVICNDGIDNDMNGQMDLADSRCMWTNDNIFCPTGLRLYTFRSQMYVPIPDNGTVTTNLPIPMTGRLFDKAVIRFALYHGLTSQLTLSLTRPGAPPQPLIMNRGAGANFLGTQLRDDMSTPIASSGSSPYTGNYGPEVPFSTYVYGSNRTLSGMWSLTMSDNAVGTTGMLMDAFFAFCVDP